ncbi:MAG: putative 2OG-Fe(II) oxygenase [Pseudomonadota bacterium]
MGSNESSEINALLATAENLLHCGNFVQSADLLEQLRRAYPSNSSVLHAIGLSKVRMKLEEEALSLFAEAYKLDRGEPDRLYADAIAAVHQGGLEVALTLVRTAAAFAPADPVLMRDFARVAIVSGALDAAVAAGRELTLAEGSPENYRLLAHAHAARSDWSAAWEAMERAVALGLDTPAARLDHAVILDEMGDRRAAAALAALPQRASSPELEARYARALAAQGDPNTALAVLNSVAQRWPNITQFHIEHAQLLYSLGEDQSAAKALEVALQDRPDDIALRLASADMMRRRERAGDARALLAEGLERSPNSLELRTSMGVVLDDLGEADEALRVLREVVRGAPDALSARLNLAAVSLRAGHAQDALGALAEVRRQRPLDQLAIAYEALALRILGDPRYRRLYDYDRLVRIFDLPPPRGWDTIESFSAELAAALRGLHKAERHPLAQSLRGGTQTDRNLPLADPLIAAFFDQAKQAVADYVSALHDSDPHPVDARKSADFLFSGTWSVRLQPNGFHVNHVHPAGWLSSAYYADLPAEIGASTQAGWLKFGEPAIPILGCGPEKLVQPKIGRLVLFPSYMWHGTVPFSSGDRLTIAFDAIPRKTRGPER